MKIIIAGNDEVLEGVLDMEGVMEGYEKEFCDTYFSELLDLCADLTTGVDFPEVISNFSHWNGGKGHGKGPAYIAEGSTEKAEADLNRAMEIAHQKALDNWGE